MLRGEAACRDRSFPRARWLTARGLAGYGQYYGGGNLSCKKCPKKQAVVGMVFGIVIAEVLLVVFAITSAMDDGPISIVVKARASISPRAGG